MSKILIAWLATTSLYAASFKFEVHHSEKINVFNMGYRLVNRLVQKEKRATEKVCATKLSEYALTSLTLDKNYKFHMNLNDLGIKVGQGKRSTIEYACELEVSGEFAQVLVEQESFNTREEALGHCEKRSESLQAESEDLIISEALEKDCKIYSL